MDNNEEQIPCIDLKFERISELRIKDCTIIKSLKESSLEEIFYHYFNILGKRRLELCHNVYDDGDFFKKIITKSEEKYYVNCMDDWEDWYDGSCFIKFEDFFRECDAFEIENEADLFDLYGYPSFPYASKIAEQILDDIEYSGVSCIFDFNVNEYIAGVLNEDIALRAEWLKIYFSKNGEYKDFVLRFKNLVYTYLNRHFVKVFSAGSKHLDGFATRVLQKERAVSGELMLKSAILEINDLMEDIRDCRQWNTLKSIDDSIKQSVETYSCGTLKAKGMFESDRHIDLFIEQISRKNISEIVDLDVRTHTVLYMFENSEYLVHQETPFRGIKGFSSKIMLVDFEFVLYPNGKSIEEQCGDANSCSGLQRLFSTHGILIKDVVFDDIKNIEKYLNCKDVINKCKFPKILECVEQSQR